MGLLRSKSVMCPVDRHCSEWARRYISYCLCSKRDGFSLGLGMISIVSWVVAEIPQIITNYNHKSSQGLSIAFLFTWTVGDFLNLFGCILEPATLPTQYYTAVLYTVTTLILVLQALYYGHVYPRFKPNKRRHESIRASDVEREMKREHDSPNVERQGFTPSSPIPLLANSPNSSHEDLYFMSARSLSFGHSPIGAFLSQRTPTSDVEQNSLGAPLLGEVRSPQSQSPKIKTMLCVASFTIFVLGNCNHQIAETHGNKGIVLQVGRQLLQATRDSAQETLTAQNSGVGSFLGWGMTAIYLGGRLPQIWLNFRRGSAEGLNPLLFVFALIGNGTYIASILIKSLDWLEIEPNLPWLVDAAGCMLLDTFILAQFVYFRYRSKNQVKKYTT